jgi:hypothetical protein
MVVSPWQDVITSDSASFLVPPGRRQVLVGLDNFKESEHHTVPRFSYHPIYCLKSISKGQIGGITTSSK